jgi:hypothetical protein
LQLKEQQKRVDEYLIVSQEQQQSTTSLLNAKLAEELRKKSIEKEEYFASVPSNKHNSSANHANDEDVTRYVSLILFDLSFLLLTLLANRLDHPTMCKYWNWRMKNWREK